jgi:hypothetical protein
VLGEAELEAKFDVVGEVEKCWIIVDTFVVGTLKIGENSVVDVMVAFGAGVAFESEFENEEFETTTSVSFVDAGVDDDEELEEYVPLRAIGTGMDTIVESAGR